MVWEGTYLHSLNLSTLSINTHTHTYSPLIFVPPPSLFPLPSLPLSSFIISTVKPNLPENYEAETWSKLAQVIVAVQLQRSISYSLEELYQAVENMCSHKMATNLYTNLRMECDRHVLSLVPKFNQYPTPKILYVHIS